MVLVVSVTLPGVGAIGWIVTRKLLGQLGGEPDAAVALARRIAQGDLTATFEMKPGDSTRMMVAMRAMNESLVKIVTEVRQSSDSIATVFTEIATGNADLS